MSILACRVDPYKLRVDTNVNDCYALTMELLEKRSLKRPDPFNSCAGNGNFSDSRFVDCFKDYNKSQDHNRGSRFCKALSAAETGVAQSIKSELHQSTGKFVSRPVQCLTLVLLPVRYEFLVNAGNVISQDEGTDVWLISHNPAGDLNLAVLGPEH